MTQPANNAMTDKPLVQEFWNSLSEVEQQQLREVASQLDAATGMPGRSLGIIVAIANTNRAGPGGGDAVTDLRVGQRVQLNYEKMSDSRRGLYANIGPGTLIGYENQRVWIQFDNGWKELMFAGEVAPAVEQIGLFSEARP